MSAVQKNWVILNYDLGLKGDYESLYAFLDNQSALDCGNSNAAFEYNFSGGEDINHQQKSEQIKNLLEERVSLKKGDRIYIIVHDKNGVAVGNFIFGNRQRSVWEGYGSKDEDDELPF